MYKNDDKLLITQILYIQNQYTSLYSCSVIVLICDQVNVKTRSSSYIDSDHIIFVLLKFIIVFIHLKSVFTELKD